MRKEGENKRLIIDNVSIVYCLIDMDKKDTNATKSGKQAVKRQKKTGKEAVWAIIGVVTPVLSVAGYFLDMIFLLSGIDSAQATLPLYALSLISNVLWTVYGIRIKDAPVIYSSIVTAVLAGILIVLTVIKKQKQSSTQQSITSSA